MIKVKYYSSLISISYFLLTIHWATRNGSVNPGHRQLYVGEDAFVKVDGKFAGEAAGVSYFKNVFTCR